MIRPEDVTDAMVDAAFGDLLDGTGNANWASRPKVKPSKEQIEAWKGDAWAQLPDAMDTWNRQVRMMELAYAAGRKAGMLEARAILASVNSFSNPMTCSDCIDEIDAAMEADK